jgi:hypothetical protein
MSHKYKFSIVVVVVMVILTALGCLVFCSPSPPEKTIKFTITSIDSSRHFPRVYTVTVRHDRRPTEYLKGFLLYAIQSSNGWSRLCNVVVSNISNSPLGIEGGYSTLWFQVAYLTNGSWNEYSTRTVDGGPGLIFPHNVITNSFEIPDGTTELKIGLPLVYCTWRSMAAWKYSLPSSIKQFLLAQDENKGSRIEWSSKYLIATNSFKN